MKNLTRILTDEKISKQLERIMFEHMKLIKKFNKAKNRQEKLAIIFQVEQLRKQRESILNQ